MRAAGPDRWRSGRVSLLLLAAAAGLWWAAPPPHPGCGLRASYWDDALRPTGEPDHVEPLLRDWSISMTGNRASPNQTVYAVRFQGWFQPPRPGRWGFALDSDDGSRLWLDGRLVVDNGLRHARLRREGFIALEPGRHELRLEYSQTIGESYLAVACRPPGADWQPLELAWLRPPDSPQATAAERSRRPWRLGLLAAAGLLAGLGLALRLPGAARRLRALAADRSLRRFRLRGWLARPLVQDLLLVAVCLPFYAHQVGVRLPHESYMKGDSIYYANTAYSLLADGDLDQRNQTDRRIFAQTGPHSRISLADSNIARGRDGRWYPKHPVLMPLVSAPFMAVWDGFGLVLYNLASLLLLLVAIRRTAALVAGDAAAAVAAVAVGLSPMFHHFAYSYCPDILSALLVTAGVGAALARRGLAAGLLLGLAVWVKLPNALALALVGGWWLAGRRWRPLLRLCAGAAVGLGLQAGLNWHMFGAPWLTGYQRVWLVEAGVHRIGSHLGSFSRPLADGLALQLTDPRHGLLATAAVALIGWLGLPRLWRRSRPAAIVIALFGALTFLFYCKYDFTHASHFSNRFLMPVVALTGVVLACLLDALRDRLPWGPRLGSS